MKNVFNLEYPIALHTANVLFKCCKTHNGTLQLKLKGSKIFDYFGIALKFTWSHSQEQVCLLKISFGPQSLLGLHLHSQLLCSGTSTDTHISLMLFGYGICKRTRFLLRVFSTGMHWYTSLHRPKHLLAITTRVTFWKQFLLLITVC